jgi:hypothetical protein
MVLKGQNALPRASNKFVWFKLHLFPSNGMLRLHLFVHDFGKSSVPRTMIRLCRQLCKIMTMGSPSHQTRQATRLASTCFSNSAVPYDCVVASQVIIPPRKLGGVWLIFFILFWSLTTVFTFLLDYSVLDSSTRAHILRFARERCKVVWIVLCSKKNSTCCWHAIVRPNKQLA